MNAQTTTKAMIQIHRTVESAAALKRADDRMITARFRNPSRSASVLIDAQAWENLKSVPETYRPLLEAVLDTAAKSILSKYLENFSTWPSEMPAHLLNESAILDAANGSNSEWLSKEELAEAWKQSATRRAFINNPMHASNPAYRKAVSKYEELLLKLAGKTSQYTPQELDLILAKMNDDDLVSEFGQFVARRVEAIRNRPTRDVVDLDLL